MQRFCADVNSPCEQKCWTNSVALYLIHYSELAWVVTHPPWISWKSERTRFAGVWAFSNSREDTPRYYISYAVWTVHCLNREKFATREKTTCGYSSAPTRQTCSSYSSTFFRRSLHERILKFSVLIFRVSTLSCCQMEGCRRWSTLWANMAAMSPTLGRSQLWYKPFHWSGFLTQSFPIGYKICGHFLEDWSHLNKLPKHNELSN